MTDWRGLELMMERIQLHAACQVQDDQPSAGFEQVADISQRPQLVAEMGKGVKTKHNIK